MAPTAEHEEIAAVKRITLPCWQAGIEPMPREPGQAMVLKDAAVRISGRTATIFTPRQLVALTTFSDLVGRGDGRAFWKDAAAAGLPDDDRPRYVTAARARRRMPRR